MTNQQFLDIINNQIKSDNLIIDDAPIIVGLSAGADSTALLYSLCQLGYNCVAAHCNFSLRSEEANRDHALAKETSVKLNVTLEDIKFDTLGYSREKNLSIEMACRELRYKWFGELCEKYNSKTIAIAHHLDDNIETFFLNLFRGTGIDGLTGIKKNREYFYNDTIKIIRPLLSLGKNDILSFLQSQNIKYATDSTNNENIYVRNKIRNIILPEIYSNFNTSKKGILTTIKNLNKSREILNGLLENLSSKYFNETQNTVDINALISHPYSNELLFHILKKYGFTRPQTNDMLSSTKHGRQFISPKYTAYINENLTIIANRQSVDNSVIRISLLNPERSELYGIRIERVEGNHIEKSYNNSILYIDSSILSQSENIYIRKWEIGDKIKPFGMKGSRKVSDIFTDLKLNRAEKKNVRIITDNKNQILWIVGIRASRLYTINDTTKSYFKISVI